MSQQTIEEIKKNLPPLEVHPAVKLPMMSEEKLKGLEMDLLRNGQRTPKGQGDRFLVPIDKR